MFMLVGVDCTEVSNTYAACLFRSNLFCCFSSFFSDSSVVADINESMLSKFRSCGISKRAFFFRMPSGLMTDIGDIALWPGLRIRLAGCSVESDEVVEPHPP